MSDSQKTITKDTEALEMWAVIRISVLHCVVVAVVVAVGPVGEVEINTLLNIELEMVA